MEHLPSNIRRIVPVRCQLLHKNAKLPTRYTAGAAGLDLYAQMDSSVMIPIGEWRSIPTGVAVAIPQDHVGLICPRSGLALNEGVTVLNGPGVIDEDYRGEIRIILVNHGRTRVIIDHGDRIAQLVVVQAFGVHAELVDELPRTDRGEGGFGSTGR